MGSLCIAVRRRCLVIGGIVCIALATLGMFRFEGTIFENATVHTSGRERLEMDNNLNTALFANAKEVSLDVHQVNVDDDSSDWFEVHCLPPSNETRLITSNNEEWCLDTSFIWRFNVTTGSSSRRRTKLGFERCMANKHLLMIGDSRTRFQYLSLTIFLTRGVFARCREGNASIPNEFCEFTHAPRVGWRDFFRNSNRVLRTNNSNELCYCVRPPYHGLNYELTRENRFFTQETKFGPIRIMYLQTYQDSCNLDISFPPYNRGHLSCVVPGLCSTQYNRTLNNTEVNFASAIECFRNVSMTAEPPVTHAFVTTGWAQKDIGCDLVRIAEATGIKTWMLGAPSLNTYNPQIPRKLPAQSCDVPVYDRETMTAGLKMIFYDSCHVETSVNEEFNHRLIDLLCPPT